MIARSLAFAAFLLACAAAFAQQSGRVHRIGVVLPFEQQAIDRKAVPVQRPLEEGLRDLGWVDGRNVQILWRAKAGIEELVRLPVDVIVAFGSADQELRATATIPIVAHWGYTAEQGMAPRTHKNLTGISVEAHPQLAQKRLELLKETAGVKRVARFYLGEPLRIGSPDEILKEYREAARKLGVEIFPVWATTPDEIRAAFREIAQRGGSGVMLGAYRGSLPGLKASWDALIEEAARHRLPTMSDVPLAADEGAMIGFGENIPARSRRLAYFVDRILRGARPSDLPIEQPLGFELVVNVKAAESIGVKVPPSVLLQADRVVR